MKLSADHGKLVLMGQRRFEEFTPHQIVTFLNQVLKTQGIIVGLRQIDSSFELSIYDADAKPEHGDS